MKSKISFSGKVAKKIGKTLPLSPFRDRKKERRKLLTLLTERKA